MKGIFVTGTDTGVGKSIISGLLARYLQDKGYKVITQKWVQTGSRVSTDINVHLRIMGAAKGSVNNYAHCVCPYIFRLPASPHLAAKAENNKISIAKIKKCFKILASKFDFVIVEGIGGALVPVDEKHLVIDIAKELGLPALVVAQNKLGVINHALMTIEVLRRRKIKILGVIFNNCRRQNKLVLKDNPEIIKSITQQKILGCLPWNKRMDLLYKKFIPLAQKIIL